MNRCVTPRSALSWTAMTIEWAILPPNRGSEADTDRMGSAAKTVQVAVAPIDIGVGLGGVSHSEGPIRVARSLPGFHATVGGPMADLSTATHERQIVRRACQVTSIGKSRSESCCRDFSA